MDIRNEKKKEKEKNQFPRYGRMVRKVDATLSFILNFVESSSSLGCHLPISLPIHSFPFRAFFHAAVKSRYKSGAFPGQAGSEAGTNGKVGQTSLTRTLRDKYT